ncbi:MAG: hypothetical protein ACYDEY_09035 [Acidimicrobiales bacterium]
MNGRLLDASILLASEDPEDEHHGAEGSCQAERAVRPGEGTKDELLSHPRVERSDGRCPG